MLRPGTPAGGARPPPGVARGEGPLPAAAGLVGRQGPAPQPRRSGGAGGGAADGELGSGLGRRLPTAGAGHCRPGGARTRPQLREPRHGGVGGLAPSPLPPRHQARPPLPAHDHHAAPRGASPPAAARRRHPPRSAPPAPSRSRSGRRHFDPEPQTRPGRGSGHGACAVALRSPGHVVRGEGRGGTRAIPRAGGGLRLRGRPAWRVGVGSPVAGGGSERPRRRSVPSPVAAVAWEERRGAAACDGTPVEGELTPGARGPGRATRRRYPGRLQGFQSARASGASPANQEDGGWAGRAGRVPWGCPSVEASRPAGLGW